MQHQLNSDALCVTINYSGAEICSIKNKAGTEFIWQADKAVWARHAPVLFPVVGKLKDNLFYFNDIPYTLQQHGFARDREFKLIENNAGRCTFELLANEGSKTNYPFAFSFKISYALESNMLTTSYQMSNASGDALFFSVGAHPGFNCPLLSGERPEDYYLEFEKSSYQLAELSGGLRTGAKRALNIKNKTLFLSPELFANDALVFENSQINSISLCSTKSAHKITMTCAGWPYFGIWGKPGAAFICLEPWYGIADKVDASQKLAEKEGIITLLAGEKFDCQFSVSIA